MNLGYAPMVGVLTDQKRILIDRNCVLADHNLKTKVTI